VAVASGALMVAVASGALMVAVASGALRVTQASGAPRVAVAGPGAANPQTARSTGRPVARPPAGVTLRLPGLSLRAGQQVSASVVNPTAHRLEFARCATLTRRVAGRWVAVTHTHGADVACPSRDPATGAVMPRSRTVVPVELYDDLVPGTYRVTLPYRTATGGRVIPAFTATSARLMTVPFHVSAFAPGPPPHLSRRRILSIALGAARREGDADPTLVQDAEGSELLANLVVSRTLVFAWRWSYLITLRGRFHFTLPTPPGIPMGPGPVVRVFRVLTVVIDARTGRITSSGTSDRYPDLARLGPVSTDRG
jgi:hypothetical protein